MKAESMQELLAKARGGDRGAAAQLHAAVNRELPWIVRRVLRKGTADDALDRRILAEARQVQQEWGPGDPDAVADEVAARLSGRRSGGTDTQAVAPATAWGASHGRAYG